MLRISDPLYSLIAMNSRAKRRYRRVPSRRLIHGAPGLARWPFFVTLKPLARGVKGSMTHDDRVRQGRQERSQGNGSTFVANAPSHGLGATILSYVACRDVTSSPTRLRADPCVPRPHFRCR